MTLDELRFDLNTDQKFIWLPPDALVPERERHKIQSEKLMLIIVWNPKGFHVINVSSKGIKFDAGHYITDALIPLAEWSKNSGR
jgi:hypothetical protein